METHKFRVTKARKWIEKAERRANEKFNGHVKGLVIGFFALIPWQKKTPLLINISGIRQRLKTMIKRY